MRTPGTFAIYVIKQLFAPATGASILCFMNVKIFAHSGKCVHEAKEKVLNDILLFMRIPDTNFVWINYETEILKDEIIAKATIFYDKRTGMR